MPQLVLFTRYLIELITLRPINAALVFAKCKFAVLLGQKDLDIVAYIAYKIDAIADSPAAPETLSLISSLQSLYRLFSAHCGVPRSSLSLTTGLLVDRFRNHRLSNLHFKSAYSLL